MFHGSMMCHTTYEWRLHPSFPGDSSMKAGKNAKAMRISGKNPLQKVIQDIQSRKINELKRSCSTSVQHPSFLWFSIGYPQKMHTSFIYPPRKWLHLTGSADLHGLYRSALFDETVSVWTIPSPTSLMASI